MPEPVYNPTGYKILAQELKNNHQRQLEAVDTYKATGRQILASASLIVSLIGALQIFGVEVKADLIGLFNGLIVISMTLYAALIAACVKVLSPISLYLPINNDWDELHEFFVTDKTDEEIYEQLVINYIDTIDDNIPLVAGRKKWLYIAIFLLVIIVLILLGMGLIPRN